MTSAHDDDAKKKLTKALTASPSAQLRGRVDDLEFSEFGRDPRYPPVWWLLPILVLCLVATAIAVFIL